MGILFEILCLKMINFNSWYFYQNNQMNVHISKDAQLICKTATSYLEIVGRVIRKQENPLAAASHFTILITVVILNMMSKSKKEGR